MQGGLTLHRVDERHVVHTGGQLGQQTAHPDPGFTMLFKIPEAGPAIARFGSKELELAVRVEGLPSTFDQIRFVVVGIDMTQPSRTKDLNDRLGFGREIWRGRDLSGSHGRHGQCPKSTSRFGEKGSSAGIY